MNFDTIGEMAIGSRLRFLSDRLTAEAENVYKAYDVGLKPKWFPVFYFLSKKNIGESITNIANGIGHSHTSVIKIVREMRAAELVLEEKDPLDGRKTNILLSAKGREISTKIENQYSDVAKAVKKMLERTNHNLWSALQEFEYLLDEQPLMARVMQEKKVREASAVVITEYREEHLEAFQKLNEQWITQYFKMEEADKKALKDPQGYILNHGGHILVATENNKVLGVCALLKMSHEKFDYELAKMAVSPDARGKGIGFLLGQALISKAKQLGAKYLYLESNTKLKPALSLYDKLGFKKVSGHKTPYERCNIQMELEIK